MNSIRTEKIKEYINHGQLVIHSSKITGTSFLLRAIMNKNTKTNILMTFILLSIFNIE